MLWDVKSLYEEESLCNLSTLLLRVYLPVFKIGSAKMQPCSYAASDKIAVKTAMLWESAVRCLMEHLFLFGSGDVDSGSWSLFFTWAIWQIWTSWPCTLLILVCQLGSLVWPPTSLIGGAGVVAAGTLAAPPHYPRTVQLFLLRCCAPVSSLERGEVPLCNPLIPALVDQLVPDRVSKKKQLLKQRERYHVSVS